MFLDELTREAHLVDKRRSRRPKEDRYDKNSRGEIDDLLPGDRDPEDSQIWITASGCVPDWSI
jgi:hypothetical protein